MQIERSRMSNPDQNNIRNDSINEPSAALRDLDIAQRRFNRVINRLNGIERDRIERLHSLERHQGNPQEIRNQERERQNIPEVLDNPPLLAYSNIQLGDRVRILNPNPGQLSEGIVRGRNRNGGFIVVDTANGQVRRIPRNLRIIRDHEANVNNSNRRVNNNNRTRSNSSRSNSRPQ